MKVARKNILSIFNAMGYKTMSKRTDKQLENKISALVENKVEVMKKLAGVARKGFAAIVKEVEGGGKVTVVNMSSTAKAKKEQAKKDIAGAEKRAVEKKVGKKKKKAPKDKGPKKPGVITTIFECVQKGPVSRKQILAKLKQRFPDREADGMEKTIRAQLPNRLAKAKGIEIIKNDKGQFKIKK